MSGWNNRVDYGDMEERTLRRTELQIVDLRRYGRDVTRQIDSRLGSVFSAALGPEDIRPGEVAWHVGGAVGGTMGTQSAPDKALSQTWSEAVRRDLVACHGASLSDVWDSRWTGTLDLAPGLLHVVGIVWGITVLSGTATFRGESGDVSAIVAAESAETLASFETEDEMDPAARAALDHRLNYLALAG